LRQKKRDMTSLTTVRQEAKETAKTDCYSHR
jgi:hypothetical protein